MDKPITTRLPNEFVIKLKEIAKKENVDLSTIIRKLLTDAEKDWKLKYALSQYSKGNFSFEQTANFAEISVWDLPMILKENKIHLNYDKEELEEDLKTLGWKKK